MPSMLDHLFRPLAIGPAELPCRIVSTAHQTTLVHDHLPTDDFVAYQQARARGGAGLIVMEAVAIAPSGLLTAHTLGGYLDGMVDGYRRVAAAVQAEGTKLFVQLFHSGREVIAAAPRPVVVSGSALPSHRYHTEPRALRTDEVEEIVAGYARSAALAADAGLDGIEVTAAHGYLAEQFFAPEWNRRDDRYGEPARFVTEVLEAVRAAAPGLALGVRLSADSAPARAVAPALAPLVDYVHVAVGNSATFDGCSGIVPPPPAPRNLIADLTEPFKLGPPLIATTRVVDPVEADRLLAGGAADAFGMNRALITDPDMPRKARAGEAPLRCIGCNACIAHYHAETPIRCAQNPRTGRERTLPRPAPASSPQRVVVVGAGPAGLAAAAEAGATGHDVVVLERTERIGGQVWLAGRAPGHEELAESLIANYEALLDRAGVELRLNTEADADAIAGLEPDLVVLATGARPAPPRQPLEGIAVAQVWDVLAGARPDGRILIADWGGDPAALDCAELLAAEARDVTLAVGALMPGETLHQYTRNGYIARLSRAGVRIEHYLGLESARGGVVRFRNIFAPDLQTEIPADALLVALGRVPDDGLGDALRARDDLVVEEAGDCRSPRSIEEAVLEGTLAARRTLAARETGVTASTAGGRRMGPRG
jgi:2,4-dienoyl-CoA reductase-like NADH-dependent reductase (Old Yellow Enzyme family)/NADPH-dependent 2,4-dienoyl-CoA reductase/sulfur reductase-like enzyme